MKAELERSAGFVKGASPGDKEIEAIESTEPGWVRLVCKRGFDWVDGEKESREPIGLSKCNGALIPEEETNPVEPEFEEQDTGGAMADKGARTTGFCGCFAASSSI